MIIYKRLLIQINFTEKERKEKEFVVFENEETFQVPSVTVETNRIKD